MQFAESLAKFVQLDGEERTAGLRQFGEELQECVNALRKQRLSAADHKEFVAALARSFVLLRESEIDELTEALLQLSTVISDRGIYQAFIANQHSFEVTAPQRGNEVVILIAGRVAHARADAKFLTVLLQELLAGTRQIEKKLFYLEVYRLVVPRLARLPTYLTSILPNILKTLHLAVQKYVKTKSKSESLDQVSEWARRFLVSFEEWLLGYLLRNAEFLVELEAAARGGEDAALVRHYVVLYFLDVFQGVIEAQNQQGIFDQREIDRFVERSEALLFRVVESKQVLVDELVAQLRRGRYEEYRNPQIIEEYTPRNRYNIIAVAKYLTDLHADRGFQLAFSATYRKRLALPVLTEFFEFGGGQFQTLRAQVIAVFSDLFSEPEPAPLRELNHYDTSVAQVLVQLLEQVGFESAKDAQSRYLAAQKNLILSFDATLTARLFEQIVEKTTNLNICAFLVGELRQILIGLFRTPDAESSVLETANLERILTKILDAGSLKPIADKVDASRQIANLLLLVLKKQPLADTVSDAHVLYAHSRPRVQAFAKQFAESTLKQLDKGHAELQREKQKLEALKEVPTSQLEKLELRKAEYDILKFNLDELETQLRSQ